MDHSAPAGLIETCTPVKLILAQHGTQAPSHMRGWTAVAWAVWDGRVFMKRDGTFAAKEVSVGQLRCHQQILNTSHEAKCESNQ